MLAGHTLRVIDSLAFQVTWSTDNWQTVQHTDARDIGFGGFYADLPSVPGKDGAIVFTMLLTASNQWIGKNFTVQAFANDNTEAAPPAADKPSN